MVVSAEALQPRSTGVTASVSGVSRPYSEASTNATDSTAVFSADQLDQLENLDLPNVSVSDGGGQYAYVFIFIWGWFSHNISTTEQQQQRQSFASTIPFCRHWRWPSSLCRGACATGECDVCVIVHREDIGHRLILYDYITIL